MAEEAAQRATAAAENDPALRQLLDNAANPSAAPRSGREAEALAEALVADAAAPSADTGAEAAASTQGPQGALAADEPEEAD